MKRATERKVDRVAKIIIVIAAVIVGYFAIVAILYKGGADAYESRMNKVGATVPLMMQDGSCVLATSWPSGESVQVPETDGLELIMAAKKADRDTELGQWYCEYKYLKMTGKFILSGQNEDTILAGAAQLYLTDLEPDEARILEKAIHEDMCNIREMKLIDILG